jgi:hypothetical protein
VTRSAAIRVTGPLSFSDFRNRASPGTVKSEVAR